MLRRALDAPGDLSPEGRFTAEISEDRVLLTDSLSGRRREIPTAGRPAAVTVSDTGLAAWVTPAPDGQGQVLSALQADGTVREVERGFGLGSPELSSDGTRLTWLHLYDVKEEGGVLARMPFTADRSEFLPDGRLLVECDRDPWSTGTKVPHYWVVDGQGTLQALEDVAEAGSLGTPVREDLAEAHRALFPGATREQGQEMVDRFGYRTPRYRGLSKSKERAVFWTPSDSHGRGSGIFLLEAGRGGVRPVDGSTKPVHGSEWAPGEEHVAVAIEGGRVVVAGFDGRSRSLSGQVASASRAPLYWSPDGRWLAVEMGKDVHLYDTREDAQYPAVADARIRGWREGLLEVEVAGATRLIPPGPLDVERGREYVLGPRPEDAGRIEVGDREIRVGEVSLPRHSGPTAGPSVSPAGHFRPGTASEPLA